MIRSSSGVRVEVAAAKVSKWATGESGDTLEMIERPHGGISFVLVDGQRSGRAAKAISNLVARKAISELAEGVRDGAAARAAHDYLYTFKKGKVTATLNMLSVDLVSNTLVLSRNSRCPVLIRTPDKGLQVLDKPADAVGVRRRVKPRITELPLLVGTLALMYTDGLERAGAVSTPVFDVEENVRELIEGDVLDAREFVDRLLDRALALDRGRPRDDISLLALRIVERDRGDRVRRLSVDLPL